MKLYGLKMFEDSMRPRVRSGDIVWIDPSNAAAKVGEDVLFLPHNEENNPRRLVRELIGQTDTDWMVRQYNPVRDTTIAKTLWPKCLRIKYIEYV